MHHLEIYYPVQAMSKTMYLLMKLLSMVNKKLTTFTPCYQTGSLPAGGMAESTRL